MANSTSSNAKNTAILAVVLVMLTLSLAAIATCGEAREQPELIGRHDDEHISISKPPGKSSVRANPATTISGLKAWLRMGASGSSFTLGFSEERSSIARLGGPNNPHHFDAYVQSRDAQRCYVDCCWNVKPARPCDCHSGECFKWND